MRVDYEKREIVCGVGDLVEGSTYRRIGVERGDGFRRMWIGQDIHTKRAEQRANEDPLYRAEVHVVPGRPSAVELPVTGRIYGLSWTRRQAFFIEKEVLHFDLELKHSKVGEIQRHSTNFCCIVLSFLPPELEGFGFAPQLVLIDPSRRAKTSTRVRPAELRTLGTPAWPSSC